MGWDRRGWTGTQWGGRYVGCPELPDGSECVCCVQSVDLCNPWIALRKAWICALCDLCMVLSTQPWIVIAQCEECKAWICKKYGYE